MVIILSRLSFQLLEGSKRPFNKLNFRENEPAKKRKTRISEAIEADSANIQIQQKLVDSFFIFSSSLLLYLRSDFLLLFSFLCVGMSALTLFHSFLFIFLLVP